MSNKTKIPTSLDGEDPFLSHAELKLSLRQMLTIGLTAVVWMMAAKFTGWLLPVNTVFAGLVWSWLLFAGLVLALVKKDGRPYEEYLSHRISFLISDKQFVQKDPRAGRDNVQDADWEEVEDDDWTAPPRL